MTSAIASHQGQGFRRDQYDGQPYEGFRGDAIAESHYVALVSRGVKAAAGFVTAPNPQEQKKPTW